MKKEDMEWVTAIESETFDVDKSRLCALIRELSSRIESNASDWMFQTESLHKDCLSLRAELKAERERGARLAEALDRIAKDQNSDSEWIIDRMWANEQCARAALARPDGEEKP